MRTQFSQAAEYAQVVMLAAAIVCSAALARAADDAQRGEVLYNGIVLPRVWPPRPENFPAPEPVTPPWLVSPPQVIPIDVGRQLFVDDFLIEQTDLARTFHLPKYHPASPVLKPTTSWENHREMAFAAPFSDGVWYDPREQVFKMWYMGGTTVFFCYATSTDGLSWTRPVLDEYRKDTNILKIEPIQRDSSTVWLDLNDPDPARRYKMVYYRSGLKTRFSADGVRWSEIVAEHKTGDRTTMFYNPFRKKWVYSVRGTGRGLGRARYYGETDDLASSGWQSSAELSKWTCADRLDREQFGQHGETLPDLYNLDATPYESLMLGMFTIHAKETAGNRPKLNRVSFAYSRDGFYWHRPDRHAALDVSDDPQAWNYGNVQSAGGGCLVVGDQMYFYCSGRNAHSEKDDGTGASTGLATLRRDGFASLDAADAPGTIMTRPVTFRGKHLFVNVAAAGGRLQAEALDSDGQPIAPFTAENCVPLAVDSTRAQVTWRGAGDLSALAGRPVRFRFTLQHGSLYAFWVSPASSGASHGYVAAGGPGIPGHVDTVGAPGP